MTARSSNFIGQFVQTGDPSTVSETTPYAPGQLGKELPDTFLSSATVGGAAVDAGKGTRIVKYVQCDSTAPLAPFLGAVAWWSDRDNFKVTTSATNRGQVAGVFMGPNPALGAYGYIGVGGPFIVKFIDAVTSAPTTAGLLVIPSSTNAKADCLASGSAATFPILGTSNAALDAGNQTAECILKLNDTNNP